MSVLDKFINSWKYNDDYDDDYDEEDDYLDDEPEEKVKPAKGESTKVTPIRGGKARSLPSDMEVCVIKPTSFEEAKEITDTLLSNRTVVLNLEGLNVDVAQRIMDFTLGSAYAIGGHYTNISHYIFVITPKSVDISGDFPDASLAVGLGAPATGKGF